MLHEYLISVLDKVEGQIEECKKDYIEKEKLKNTIKDRIEKIESNGEINMEYFSPRDSKQSLRKEIGNLCGSLEKMSQELDAIKKNLEGLEKESKTFQLMLDELMELEKKANVSRETFK